jgi:glycosyltransferase involved in cell wall biosynthesis
MVPPNHSSLQALVISASEGNDAYVQKLLTSLQRRGYTVTLVGWDRYRRLSSRFIAGGIGYKMIFRGWGYANRWLMLGLPLWTFRVFRFLLRQHSDFLIVVNFDTGVAAALAQLITRAPFIYDIRDNFDMRPTLPSVLRPVIAKLDQWVIAQAARVLVPDENRIVVSDEHMRCKFIVIANCAPEIEPPSDQCKDRPFTIYASGYLLGLRGIHLLLDAAMRIPDIRVLMAGHVLEVDLAERIRQTPNVDFRGWLTPEEALRLNFEADVIFSFYDPASEINRRAASSKWSDAMMASKPILVNSEVLKSTWIQQQDMGYLCPYGDVDQLIQVIKHIRHYPEEARRKGENGRRVYDRGYSWSAMQQRLWRLLDEMRQDGAVHIRTLQH